MNSFTESMTWILFGKEFQIAIVEEKKLFPNGLTIG